MATRYSGRVKITVLWSDKDAFNYDVRLSAPGEKTEHVRVGAPKFLMYPVDSPIAYDQAAHAALSFSSNDMQEQAQVNREGSGWHVSRSKAKENPTRKLKRHDVESERHHHSLAIMAAQRGDYAEAARQHEQAAKFVVGKPRILAYHRKEIAKFRTAAGA